MRRSLRLALVLATVLLPGVGHARAQDVESAPRYLLDEVMPGANRFDAAEGDPPVKRAYRGDELLGYVFLTSDFPPEKYGYSGPIRTLIGMTPDGVLTGVQVTQYHESRMYDWGDFLREPPWFLDQLAGKYVGDHFRVNDDIDGITQATISARALAVSVRDVARRVAVAYAARSRPSVTPVPEADLLHMSWYDMQRRGVATTVVAAEDGKEPVRISLVHVQSEELGRYLLGRIYEKIAGAVEQRGGADNEVLYVVAGSNPRLSLEKGWSIEQGGKTTSIPEDDIVPFGVPGGVLLGESTYAGVMLLDDDQVDLTQPFTFAFTGGLSDMGPFRAEYTSQAALARLADTGPTTAAAGPAHAPREMVTAAPGGVQADNASAGARSDSLEAASPDGPSPSGPESTAVVPANSGPTPPSAPDAATAAPGRSGRVAALPAPETPVVAPPTAPEQAARFDFTVAEEGAYDGLLGSVSWTRVGWTVLVLVLACLAFFMKNAAMRWVSLLTTLVVLGWVDGGFLSVSHITGLVWVGPSAILSDPPLLIMVSFTVLTTLLWGRIFCGFLCPFGVLQDLIDGIVPTRFKRELPRGAHRLALKVKYGILAVILVPAIAGIQVSLYQYFEPFGTVFFISRSVLLWAIAASILLAAAIVPRFYCRYVCPLGATLAIGSVLSLSRIRRVEQCDYCKVCERRCPTGAIDGPEIDFKECVRCNDCEIQLLELSGVCKHDMDAIRPRLVQLAVRTPAGALRAAR